MSFSLSAQSAGEYLAQRGIKVKSARELGGGVSNTVIWVEAVDSDPFILKQALPQLRVQDEWLAERSRIFRERDGLIDVARLLPRGQAPAILWSDDDNFLYAMEAVSPAVSWKDRLLAGDLNPAYARAAGQALGMTIAGSWQDFAMEQRYGDQRAFDQLRTDPYYRTVARRHPAIVQQVYDWIAQIEPLRLALTHGDWSPKNMLVRGDGLVFIDYECIHFGDPSYDIAFCLNHLCLKAFHMPEHATALHDLARTFLSATLASAPYEGIEARAARHLAFLMLARVDGKSPAEYLDEPTRARVRQTALRLIAERPTTVEHSLAYCTA
ncbi:MAG: phosphotransferase [Bryobacterales bacterium]|nr:phosphotransferase [Bryobacterales bacterium]